MKRGRNGGIYLEGEKGKRGRKERKSLLGHDQRNEGEKNEKPHKRKKKNYRIGIKHASKQVG